ncbi:MAG: hypothetical protein AAF488_18240 [Planctomycetota bacterium]
MIYEIDARDTLVYVDDEWDRFADANSGNQVVSRQVLGTCLWSHIRDRESQHLYEILCRQVRTHRRTASIPFRCDSPTERRHLRLDISPMEVDLHLRFETLTEKVEPRTSAETRAQIELDRIEHVDGGAMLVVCSWCKRVRRHDRAGWAEVEILARDLKLFELEELPCITHGVCAECAERVRREIAH